MKNHGEELIYIVERIEKYKNDKGIFLNASAYDDIKKMYHNIRLYIPYKAKNNLMYILNVLGKNNDQKGVVLSFNMYEEGKGVWYINRLYFSFPLKIEKHDKD